MWSRCVYSILLILYHSNLIKNVQILTLISKQHGRVVHVVKKNNKSIIVDLSQKFILPHLIRSLGILFVFTLDSSLLCSPLCCWPLHLFLCFFFFFFYKVLSYLIKSELS